MALALRLGPHPKHCLTGWVDAQLRAVEHPEAEDVVLGAVAGAHHLGEARNADAGDLALLATRFDVLAHLVVAELLERDIHRLGVVATVVLPAGGGVVRKLLRLDEVLHPELGLVHAKLDRGVGDEALDQVTRLGHPERAPVGDASGSLVRVVAVGRDVCGRDVIGAGDDVEEPGLELGRLRVCEKGAVVAVQVHAQGQHLAVLVQSKVACHMEVAGETRGDQVLVAVLDPFHGAPDEQAGRGRDDIAWVDGHLVAEASPDVGRDDPDVLLGQAGDECEHGADGVRGLARHVDRRLACCSIDVGDAAARLERSRVAARIERVQPHDLVGLRECGLRGRLVARFPVIDVVVFLVFLVVADQRRACFLSLLRADHRRQDVVLDDDRVARVLGLGLRLGHDRGDLLALEADLVGRQHGLGVVAERGHPRQLVLRHQLARDHRDHSRHRARSRSVYGFDAGVSVRAAQDDHVQHRRQFDVVQIVALASQEPPVFLALDRLTDTPVHVNFGRHHSPPVAAPAVSRGAAAASTRILAAY